MKLGTNVLVILVIPCTPSNPSYLLESFPPADSPRLTGKLLPEKRGDKFTNRFILQGLTKAREVEQGGSAKRVDHKNDYPYLIML